MQHAPICSFIYKIVLICSLLLFVSQLPAQNKDYKTFRLVVAADMPDIFDDSRGSYPHLKELLKQQRNTQDSSPVLFFFGGGSIGPSAMSAFDRGSHIIDLLNTLEPDVMGVAKREFSYFEDELSLRAYEAAFPIVTSNVEDFRINDVLDGLHDTTIIQKGGLSIGFISIVNERLIDEYLLTNVGVNDPLESVKSKAVKLRKQGVDLIVLHYSFPFDFVKDLLDDSVIDLAFLSDTRLQKQYKEDVIKHENILFMEEPGLAQIAEFTFYDKFQLESKRTVQLSELATDSGTNNQVLGYKVRLDRLLNERIGYWSSQYTTRREDVRGSENAFVNFVVDSMREFEQADIALLNGGSIRGDRTYESGSSITRRDIATELPFRSSLSVLSISGGSIIKALESALAAYDDVKGAFPHVSGMEVYFDTSKPPYSRVQKVLVAGKPIREDKIYRLATSDYLANGGDGLSALQEGKKKLRSQVDNTILITDLVIQNIRLKGGVDAQLESRLVNLAAPGVTNEAD